MIGAVQAAWEKLPSLHEQRQALQARAEQFRQAVQGIGFDTGTSTTHIVPLIVGEESTALALKAFLLARGLLTSAVRPPTVPPHTARVRVALSVSHTDAQIAALLAALVDWQTTV